jgi:L-2,4-diaminobutyrate decarboxylase
MSPVATAIDRDVLARFKRLFGYPRHAEGSLVPGGAFGNLTALLVARDSLEPRASKTGVARIALIAGAQAHHTISRAAALLGLETDAVFTVPLDPEFRTDASRIPLAFGAARRAGFRKFILIATAGSTPTGSIDDLGQLHRTARKERAWFHVDAAHGAGLAFSGRLRRRLKGLSLADSITFDPHKMMFMPLSAGGVLVRDGRHLTTPLEEHAPYLFGARRRWPDVGQFTLACSQRFDALKLWLLWRAYGLRLWDVLVTHVCEVARAAYRYCSRSDVLAPLHEPHSNILCFQLRGRRNDVPSDRLHWTIKEQLNESGFGYISSAVLNGRRVLRLVVMNPRTTVDDVCRVLERIESIANAMTQKPDRRRRQHSRGSTDRITAGRTSGGTHIFGMSQYIYWARKCHGGRTCAFEQHIAMMQHGLPNCPDSSVTPQPPATCDLAWRSSWGARIMSSSSLKVTAERSLDGCTPRSLDRWWTSRPATSPVWSSTKSVEGAE